MIFLVLQMNCSDLYFECGRQDNFYDYYILAYV